MKSLLTILTFVFTVMFSSASYAEWMKAGENANGIFYVDFERIRKHDRYVYFWVLSDYPKPTKYGDLSYKSYNQGDCTLFRYKVLSDYFYETRMGQGTPSTSYDNPDKNWTYPIPQSSIERILKSVCSW